MIQTCIKIEVRRGEIKIKCYESYTRWILEREGYEEDVLASPLPLNAKCSNEFYHSSVPTPYLHS